MKIYLIRHAEIAGDPHAHFSPPVSGCLSPEGCEQAARLGDALKNVEFHGVYASPLGRAIETAQALKSQSGEIDVRDWLVEWRPSKLLMKAEDTVWEEMMQKMGDLRVEETWETEAGEAYLQMAGRIIPGFLALLREEGVPAGHGAFLVQPEAEQRQIAIVAHGGSLNVLCQFLLNVPLSPRPCVSFEQTGFAIFDFMRRVDVFYPVLQIPAPARLSE